jgi:DNA helicase HerA-like ATPase
MSIRVGEVIAVRGILVTLRIDEDSSKETLFFEGDKYKGVSIREYLSIQRGFRDIVCLVEGEYLDESRVETAGSRPTYIRKVEARPIGYFEDGQFKQGIKFLPMIRDAAFLMQEQRIADIYAGRLSKSGDAGFIVGRMLKEGIPIQLPWQRLFNSHIGIFGNTGSGKSNTLTKLFTVLFDQKVDCIRHKSAFILIDFNGEYAGEQIAEAVDKQVYRLSTRKVQQNGDVGEYGDRFPLNEDEFWSTETLALLFQATQNTQRPFINRIVEGRRKFEVNIHSLSAYAKSRFRQAFTAGEARPATLDLMRSVAKLVGHQPLLDLLKQVSFHGGQKRFTLNGNWLDPNGENYDQHLAPTVEMIDASGLDSFEQLVLRANLQLIDDLVHGFVQFEHIQPLLKRIDSSLSGLKKVLQIVAPAAQGGADDVGAVPPPANLKLLTVISLRRCNNEVRKVLPLLLAKHYYNSHRDSVGHPPERTIHLIVDEAHNILSEQSTREHESWKDYRLEQFEEIIKEGRKFGIFITIASQRPADISPTIVSQLHNFFIHRLVNDRDLFLIDNTITTLDRLSRSLIPTLAQGCCVVTGTSFDLPMVLQVDRLEKEKQPDSEDIDLEALWIAPGADLV